MRPLSCFQFPYITITSRYDKLKAFACAWQISPNTFTQEIHSWFSKSKDLCNVDSLGLDDIDKLECVDRFTNFGEEARPDGYAKSVASV